MTDTIVSSVWVNPEFKYWLLSVWEQQHPWAEINTHLFSDGKKAVWLRSELMSLTSYQTLSFQTVCINIWDDTLLKFYLSWQWPSWEHWGWRQQCSRGQTCACARQSCEDGSRSGLCWAAGAHGRESEHLVSWGSPACHCLRWCAPHNPENRERRSGCNDVMRCMAFDAYKNDSNPPQNLCRL